MASKNVWATSLFTAAVVALGTAAGLADSKPRPMTPLWVALLVVFAGICAAAAVGLVLSARKDRPSLAFGDPWCHEWPVVDATAVGRFQVMIGPTEPIEWSSTKAVPLISNEIEQSSASVRAVSDETPSELARFVYVPVLNIERVGRRQAEQVYARISYLSADRPIFSKPLDGRWTGTTPDFRRTRPRAIEAIPPNGSPYDLDIAMKYEADDSCYAVNDDNMAYQGMRDPAHRIASDHVIVRVEVGASGLKRLVGDFDLRHDGAGSTVSLARHLEPRYRTLCHPFRRGDRNKGN